MCDLPASAASKTVLLSDTKHQPFSISSLPFFDDFLFFVIFWCACVGVREGARASAQKSALVCIGQISANFESVEHEKFKEAR